MTFPASRADLVGWLNAPAARASRWQDWRDLGGRWYLDGGVDDLRNMSDDELARKLADCDRVLGNASNTREALSGIVNVEQPNYGRAVYNAAGQFTAGTLFYSENFLDFITFLALARSAADALAPGGTGHAAIHDYTFGNGTNAALRLGPRGQSLILDESEYEEAVACFQPLADTMMSSEEQARTVSELDSLR